MRTIIKSTDKASLDLLELKRYAGLLKYLSMRDVIVRYKQTWIGLGWSIFRPLINIAIFGSLSLLLNKGQSVRENYITVSAAIIFWQLISTSITDVSNSLSTNANILSKVYFPKLIFPVTSLLVCIIDFLISFVLYLICYLFLKDLPPWQICFLPIVLIIGLLFSFSIGVWFAAASVKFRDVKFILPFLLQIIFYASPIFISSNYIMSLHIPNFLKKIYLINPFVGLMNAYKYCFFGEFEFFSIKLLVVNIITLALLLVVSIRYFLKFEKSFADYI
ncbi:MAG: ABC transporter permease [Bacteroidetes bacterium]|nr:ABC transporter permease [Bacteroidota bacterium]